MIHNITIELTVETPDVTPVTDVTNYLWSLFPEKVPYISNMETWKVEVQQVKEKGKHSYAAR